MCFLAAYHTMYMHPSCTYRYFHICLLLSVETLLVMFNDCNATNGFNIAENEVKGKMATSLVQNLL